MTGEVIYFRHGRAGPWDEDGWRNWLRRIFRPAVRAARLACDAIGAGDVAL
jgi:hypothetical protein